MQLSYSLLAQNHYTFKLIISPHTAHLRGSQLAIPLGVVNDFTVRYDLQTVVADVDIVNISHSADGITLGVEGKVVALDEIADLYFHFESPSVLVVVNIFIQNWATKVNNKFHNFHRSGNILFDLSASGTFLGGYVLKIPEALRNDIEPRKAQ